VGWWVDAGRVDARSERVASERRADESYFCCYYCCDCDCDCDDVATTMVTII